MAEILTPRCPRCGSANPEHERGLLFCGACGLTWEPSEDSADG